MNNQKKVACVMNADRLWNLARPASWIGAAAMAMAMAGAAPVMAASLTLPASSMEVKQAFDYFATTGLPKSSTRQAEGGRSQKLVTAYGYTAAGNRESEQGTGWAGQFDGAGQPVSASRGSTTTWSQDGRFPATMTNAKSQSTEFEYDARFGSVTLAKDPNGLVTRWEYDDFGRKTFERRGYASRAATTYVDYTQWSYDACESGCGTINGATVRLVIQVQVKGSDDTQIAPTTKTYFDEHNREIRSETETLNGSNAVAKSFKDTVYDAIGNVWRVSLPYFESGSPQWVESSYDDLQRKTAEVAPNGVRTTIAYSGTTTTTTTTVRGVTRQRIATRNTAGQVVQTTDESGNTTGYAYDAIGNLSRTLGAYGDVVAVSFDVLARKVGMDDPNAGKWTYEPNAFGETVSQTSPLNKTSSLSYDELGRVVKRVESDLTSTFVYDTAANGIGKLAYTVSDNGYCREQGYDALGRPSVTVLKVGMGAQACASPSDALSASVAYDAYGRLQTQTFPTGLSIKQLRNSIGAATSVVNAGNETKVYWTRKGTDAAGRLTAYDYGNGVGTKVGYDTLGMGWIGKIEAGPLAAPTGVQFSVYGRDEIGHLSSREDSFDLPLGLTENVDVDVQGRPKSYYRKNWDGSIKEETRVNVDYDSVGRIVRKSDVGEYYYARPNDRRPHAVTAVRGVVNADYGYDDAGQMTTRKFSDYLYTDAGFLRMAGGPQRCHEFWYQGEAMRVQQVIYGGDCRQNAGQPANGGTSVLARTLYMHPDASNGLSFERETKSSGGTFYKHYLTVDGRAIAEIVSTSGSVGASTPVSINYLHYDHLGSVVAVTNADGVVIERRSFDVWGRPRETNGTAVANGDLPNGLNAATDRGFTLHEHLEGLDLIHMNGRAYDPLIGRFTSADPLVQAPNDGQSYDRYAYVLNSPLDAIDPTGFAAETPGYADMPQMTQTGPGATSVYSILMEDNKKVKLGGNGQTIKANDSSISRLLNPTYPSMLGDKTPPIKTQDNFGEIKATPYNVWTDDPLGRAFNHATRGLAAFTKDSVNPITGEVVNMRGNNRTVALTELLTLPVGMGSKAEQTILREGLAGAAGVVAALEAGSIRGVNAAARGTQNCVLCAIATDATLAGRPTPAAGGGPFYISMIEQHFRTTFGAPGTIQRVTAAMEAAGNGARGIVFGSRGGEEVGHVFNVVNQRGTIRYLDGQTGKSANLDDGYVSFQLLRTNK
jgi:RHS repeat-associated protein